MGTKVSTTHEIAKVECPKETGEMKDEVSCRECKYWIRCMNAILGVL